MNFSDLIQNFGFPQEQKSFWEEKIKTASETEKEAYLAMFQNYPADVLWVTESFIEAEKAREAEDIKKYDKIKKEVAEKLNKILFL